MAPAPESPQPPPHPAPDENALDRLLRLYLEDSALWPLVMVAVAIFATLATGVVLLATVDRNPVAALGLALLAWISLDVVRGDWRRRSLGPTAGVVLTIWGLAGLAAVAAARGGLF